MYSARPGLIIAFHGCEKAVRDAIVAGQTMLKVSRNGHDWLGHGFYFWEGNYARALEFAIHPPGKKRIVTPAVLGAVIDLYTCLDMMDAEHIGMVKNAYKNYALSVVAAKTAMPQNKKVANSKDLLLRELDCSVIESLHSWRRLNNEKPFDSVRGLFVEGDPIYENAGFHEKNHIQICIRNPNCIKGFFIPRQEIQWAA